MFSLTIVFGTKAPVLWTLLYQTEGGAKAAYNKCMMARGANPADVPNAHGVIGFSSLPIHQPMVILEDDFSQSACVDSASIQGFMIEDMDRSQIGQIEKALHDRRAQVKFEALVNSDPGLRQQQRQPSMPILQPMGNGFRPVS